METRYILPATVATAFHALVFFGYNPPHLPRTTPSPPKVILRPIESVVFEQPSEERDPDSTVSGAKDPRQVDRPEQEEHLMPNGDIEMPRVTIAAPHLTPASRIEPGPIGPPNGDPIDGSRGSILNVASLDNPPRTRSQVAPVYPSDAKNSGSGGEVTVEFVVDESGRVCSPHVIRSSDYRFDSATLHAVEKWRFEPGKKNGRPVRFRMEVPVQFSLQS